MADTAGRAAEKLFAMTDRVWARHANPWSFYTRIPILPLLALSIYARTWIGWWCVLPILALLVWMAINPRAFAQPATFDSYAARGVLGERVWLARSQTPIPEHHARAAYVLVVLSILGLLPLAYGLLMLDPFAVLSGLILTVGAKLWFVDRMVWLYDDVGEDRFRPDPA